MPYNPNSILRKSLDFKKDCDTIINEAKIFAEYLSKQDRENRISALTSNQLRKFYGEVKRQQLNGYDPVEFKLLKPKLAYAVGRNSNNKISDFYSVMSDAIDSVYDKDSFDNFIKMFEAIVAYQKLFGK